MALAIGGLVTVVYLWFASAGTFRVVPGGGFYELLGDAFLAGQLHLQTAPKPELLALPDPYDPVRNEPYRLHDASLYNGRYYLYWGPVPGLVHAAWKGLGGQPTSTMLLQVLAGLGGCVWFWLLARTLRDRAFPGVPDWQVYAVSLCYALGGVALYLQVRPTVYHEAFVWASFFLLGGLYWWVRGLADGRHALWQLGLAGLLFGCALGSRTTLAFYALGAGLVLAVDWFRGGRRPRARKRLLAFTLPVGLCGVLLLLYNQLRFDSPLEFGQAYLLSGSDQHPKFSLGFIPLNLAAYLLFLPRFIAYFPFQYSPRPPAFFVSDTWSFEHPMSSMFVLAPLALLAPLVLAAFRPEARRAMPLAAALVVAGGAGTLGAFGLLLIWNSASGRYLQDILPVVSLLGVLGLWWIRPGRAAPRLGRLAHGSLSAAILAISSVAGLTYGFANLSLGNPDAYTDLAYRSDRVVGSVLQRVAPRAWPSSYLAPEVQQRPGGIFYPDRSMVLLPASGAAPIEQLTVESIAPSDLRVGLEIDGHHLGDERVEPGRQTLRLAQSVALGAGGRAAVRLELRGEPPEPVGLLWPLRLIELGPLRVDPQMVIDVPRPEEVVTQPFVLRGWAVDREAEDTGVDAVAIWAHPASGAPPTLLGLADYGAARPDVGRALGPRFTNSGYAMSVGGLQPGVWQLVVYAHNSTSDQFNDVRTVTVTVR